MPVSDEPFIGISNNWLEFSTTVEPLITMQPGSSADDANGNKSKAHHQHHKGFVSVIANFKQV